MSQEIIVGITMSLAVAMVIMGITQSHRERIFHLRPIHWMVFGFLLFFGMAFILFLQQLS